MGSDILATFTADDRRRAAKILADFTPEERQRATELYATLAELERRQTRLLAAVRTKTKRTQVKKLEREARAIGVQTATAFAEVTAILGQGIERARAREEVAV